MPQADVLVVDDSMSARFALTRSLQPHGLNIETANSGEEALETVARSRYDLIFMDHVLPGITGLDAAEKIRAMPEFANTPIVMCSSNEGEDYVQEALRRGASDVIGKPPQEAALSRVVEKYLSTAAEAAPAMAAEASAPAPAAEMPEETPAPTQPSPAMTSAPDAGGDDRLAALDARIEKLEGMLVRLESSIAELNTKTETVARSIADQAGRDLANRLLRAVITLKGSK